VSSWAEHELALEAQAAGRHCVYLCVCVCARERVCVYVCASSWAEHELALEAQAAGRHCVFMCVCVCARERESVCEFVGRARACSRGAGCR